tara:strand:- start:938 stop:1168 length:231 start_codon:yes stop_codon:yes gene_type:complete
MATDKLEKKVIHNKAVKKLINDGPPGRGNKKDLVSFSLFNNKTGKSIFTFSLFKKDQKKAVNALKKVNKPQNRKFK